MSFLRFTGWKAMLINCPSFCVASFSHSLLRWNHLWREASYFGRFLMEIGALLLMDDNDTSLSIKDMYAKVSGCAWELFEVYRHLKSLGYIVGRHGIAWSTKGVKSSSESVSLQGSPQSSEVDVELKDKGSIIGLFNDLHINEARAVFDVYLPNSRFRKSSPGNPRFVLCLTR